MFNEYDDTIFFHILIEVNAVDTDMKHQVDHVTITEIVDDWPILLSHVTIDASASSIQYNIHRTVPMKCSFTKYTTFILFRYK